MVRFFQALKPVLMIFKKIFISLGSFQCRVGWACNKEPSLIFRNLIAKPRKDRTKKDEPGSAIQPPIQIGNELVNIEALRFQLKTQFDRNVVTHFQIQEQIFDYVFKHLGINQVGISHPIVMTECYGNPNSCRACKLNFFYPKDFWKIN